MDDFVINPPYYFMFDGKTAGVDNIIPEDQRHFVRMGAEHIKKKINETLRKAAMNARADYITYLKNMIEAGYGDGPNLAGKGCDSGKYPFGDRMETLNVDYCRFAQDNIRSYTLIYDLMATLHLNQALLDSPAANGGKSNVEKFRWLIAKTVNGGVNPHRLSEIYSILKTKRQRGQDGI